MSTVAVKTIQASNMDSPRIHKKYLGEAGDLHFIPSSPYISRQCFTEQEEGELKRLCTLALSKVQHSDDTAEDALQYLASQIQAAPDLPPINKAAEHIPFLEPPTIPGISDTRTPSESSKRDTIDIKTAYSTPLTSAGVTPGASSKRFSGVEQMTGSPAKVTFDAWQRNKSKARSRSPAKKQWPKIQEVSSRKNSLSKKSSHKRKEPSVLDSKSSLRLVRKSSRPSDLPVNSHARSAELPRTQRFSQLELNKELPPLPRSDSEPAMKTRKANPPAFRRMMKSMKKRPNTAGEAKRAPMSPHSDKAPLISNFNRSADTKVASSPLSSPATPTVEGKWRFRLKLFSRQKSTPVPTAVTVT